MYKLTLGTDTMMIQERKHTHSCTMSYWYAVHMCDSLITGARQEKGEKEVATVFYCQKCFLKHKNGCMRCCSMNRVKQRIYVMYEVVCVHHLLLPLGVVNVSVSTSLQPRAHKNGRLEQGSVTPIEA